MMVIDETRLVKTIELDIGYAPNPICFKASTEMIAELNKLMKELGIDSRSELIRKMIEYALQHLDDFRRWLGR